MARLFSELTDEQIDRFPVLDASLDDLDMEKVGLHITRAIDSARCQARVDQPIDFLKRHRGVVEHDGMMHPTVAGLLMFGADPQVFLPHAIVGLAHFPGRRTFKTILRIQSWFASKLYRTLAITFSGAETQ